MCVVAGSENMAGALDSCNLQQQVKVNSVRVL